MMNMSQTAWYNLQVRGEQKHGKEKNIIVVLLPLLLPYSTSMTVVMILML